jgi:hypothetical protein
MSFSRFILVQGWGRFANQVIQAMAAQQVKEDLCLDELYLPRIPSWGIEKSRNYQLRQLQLRLEIKAGSRKSIRLGGSGGDWRSILQDAQYERVHLVGTGVQIKNIDRQREFAQELLSQQTQHDCCIDDNQLQTKLKDFHLVHIRQGDIFKNYELKRPDYYPLPVKFYESIASNSAKPLAFIGEINANLDYVSELKKRCKSSIIVPLGCLHRDFKLLQEAELLTMAVSTFSWLASWISEKAVAVNIPIAGFLNPAIRPDMDLSSDLPERFIKCEIDIPVRSNPDEFRKWLFD